MSVFWRQIYKFDHVLHFRKWNAMQKYNANIESILTTQDELSYQTRLL